MTNLSQRSALKMNGLGNEIVVLDLRDSGHVVTAAEARAIGGIPGLHYDQLMVLHAPRTAGTRAFVLIYNIDGSEAGACGNGTRCVAWMLAGEQESDRFAVETRAGILECARLGEWSYAVDMGAPLFGWADIPISAAVEDTTRVALDTSFLDAGYPADFAAVSMGNPHAIFFVDDVESHDLSRTGPMLETHPMFPARANISLARVTARDALTLKVWERGGGTDTRLRIRRLRGRCRSPPTWPDRPRRAGDPAGRRPPHLLAHGRPRDHDGPRRVRIRGDARATLLRGRRLTVETVTFGCRLNTAESEAMRRAAEAAGQRDLVIVNSCAVTAEAVAQARQRIRRLKRENPRRRIVVTGCAAQTEPATFAAMPEVSKVVGNAIKARPDDWRLIASLDGLTPATERVRVNDIMAVRETAPHMADAIEGRARAIVQVQNGCDHRCTFCIIPFGRGNSRSSPMGAVVEQVQRLVDEGYLEVVLTGVDLTSWGQDLPGAPRLGTLVKQILRHAPSLRRIRLSSIDQIEADETLMEVLATEQRFAPYLHLSLQAGDDMILKRMKRRHSRDDAIRFCADARRLRPDIAFGADIIAGFPTEDEAMFDRSLALADECGLSFLHVFPFSARPGTPAARMPQLPGPVVRERARRLRDKGAERLRRHLDLRLGFPIEVLTERGGIARAADFTPMRLNRDLPPGELHMLAAASHDGQRLIEAGP